MLDASANEIIKLYYKDYKFFFSKPNVIGIGYGYKVTNGNNTFKPCIQVFVEKKLNNNCIPNNGLIPSLYQDVPTDVVESGSFITGKISNLINNNSNRDPIYGGRIRPLQPGWSLSTDFSFYTCGNDLTGTFGYIVTDTTQTSKTYCLLSVNGTFADWNNYPEGGNILQPSYQYGGRSPDDVVAKLLRYEPLKFRLPNDPPPPLNEMNIIDASVASLIMTTPVQLINPFIVPNNIVPKGITSPELGMNVSWTGCFRGLQTGSITSVKTILPIEYFSNVFGHRRCWFKDVSLCSGDFAEADVGALVYTNNDQKALGLHFSISSPSNRIVFCDITSIENILNVKLIT